MTTLANADPSSDAREVLQLLLNAPQLAQYYHFDVRPQRKPLRIHNQTSVAIAPENLTAIGEPVELTQNADPNTLEIAEFQIDGGHAAAKFAWHVEGIAGTVEFSKQQGVWRLDHINVAEH
ncbi:MAG: hypothetical protein ACKN9T_12465 [Candidatus Methylumidiphilus sp.]